MGMGHGLETGVFESSFFGLSVKTEEKGKRSSVKVIWGKKVNQM
jgi:hypothetical protein